MGAIKTFHKCRRPLVKTDGIRLFVAGELKEECCFWFAQVRASAASFVPLSTAVIRSVTTPLTTLAATTIVTASLAEKIAREHSRPRSASR